MEQANAAAPARMVIGVVGNPNCGKTTLFNALTGSRQHVGNWPGVTVEKKVGSMRLGDASCEVVDLPGVYSLGAVSHASEDERVARDYVLSGEAQLIVNIVDASNLERNLYLTTQLLEMQVPLVVVLNMMDIARERGLAIDLDALSKALGCPVVPLVATRKKGVAELKETVLAAARSLTVSPARPVFEPAVEAAVEELATLLSARVTAEAGQPRWLAVKLLEGDEHATRQAGEALAPLVAAKAAEIEAAAGEEPDILIADGRFAFVTRITGACLKKTHTASRPLSDRIDKVVLNRVLGIPIFLVMMYLMFVFTINIGGAFQDFFDKAGEALLIDGTTQLLHAVGTPEALVILLAKGVGGGMRTVATFIPIIGCLYLFLSFLEDSGYMARAAFVMDRAMRALGLPGKSFVPLIVGFGCNVPAIMATRTLEHRRDRVLTAMMAPFMSCGARLPVYALFAAAFFPEGGQNVVFALYLIGIGFAVLTGLVLKSTLLKGQASSFVMELPPYHLPTVGTVVRRAVHRLRDFVFRAGRVIVPMVVLLSFFNALGTDGSFGNEDSENSMLAEASRKIIPIFRPMGMTDENWPAAVGIFTGVFAKEAVVGTLNALYARLGAADDGGAAADAPAGIADKLADAVASIPNNLGDVAHKVTDPLGLSLTYVGDKDAAARELKVATASFGAMAARFDGGAGAFAYLLIILLYMPCVAATGTILRETGWRWTLFGGTWTTGLGYTSSVAFYQAAHWAEHPAASAAWIGGCLAAVLAAVAVMRLASGGTQPPTRPATEAAE